MKRKEVKKDMAVKEGDQSKKLDNKGEKIKQGEAFKSPKELDGMQSMKPEHKKKALPKDGPFAEPEAQAEYDVKKDTL